MTDIDWTCTLYKLFLGDQQTVPPYFFQQGYTIHSIEVVIQPEGTPFFRTDLGRYGSYNAVGYTEYILSAGDVILDAFGDHYLIKTTPKRWALGDQQKYFVLALEKMKHFPFLSGFFGFEDTEHGTIGYGFEDGFERGYWAL